MTIRHVAILHGECSLAASDFSRYPGIEAYAVDAADAEFRIDMILLDDIHSRLALVFVGGDAARRLSVSYGATWIADGSTALDNVLRFFGYTRT